MISHHQAFTFQMPMVYQKKISETNEPKNGQQANNASLVS